MDNTEKEFELEFLSTGEVLFRRYDEETNGYIIQLLKGVSARNFEDLQKFLESSESITRIFGQENYCG